MLRKLRRCIWCCCWRTRTSAPSTRAESQLWSKTFASPGGSGEKEILFNQSTRIYIYILKCFCVKIWSRLLSLFCFPPFSGKLMYVNSRIYVEKHLFIGILHPLPPNKFVWMEIIHPCLYKNNNNIVQICFYDVSNCRDLKMSVEGVRCAHNEGRVSLVYRRNVIPLPWYLSCTVSGIADPIGFPFGALGY